MIMETDKSQDLHDESAAWSLLLYSDLQLIGRGPPTLGTVMGITQSIHLNVNITPKHHHRHLQNDD